MSKSKTATSINKKYSGYKYGIGIEHEMYMFHFPERTNQNDMEYKDPIKNIILAPSEAYQVLIINNDLTSESDRKFIGKVPYEPTGRICNGKVVLSSLPGVWTEKERMPEFITDFPISEIKRGVKRRTLYDYSRSLKTKQFKYLRILNNNLRDLLKGKIEKYGNLMESPFGMSSYIKLPINYKSKFYKFKKRLYKDYTGSYHITITLPYKENMKLDKFIDIHQNFANMIQWLEPLLVSAYFSADDRSMGTEKKRVRGSFRVMRVGWGNFAGSNVKKFKEGIGRYADVVPNWRKGLKFEDVDIVNRCKDLAPSIRRRETGAISGFSSNFRTFGSTDPDRPWHRESGAGMTIGNGIEIRIFDHFQILYLDSLLQFIGAIAENSRKHKCKKYVYKDKDWIKSLQTIMLEGWSGKVTKGYVNKLRKYLKLRVNTVSLQAYEVFKTIYKELYDRNKNGDYCKILLGEHSEYIELPKVNQRSWEFGLSLKLNTNKTLVNKVNKFLKNINLDLSVKEIEKIFFKFFTKKNWGNTFYIFMCYLETVGILKLDKNNKSNIIKIYKEQDEINMEIINTFILNQCYNGLILRKIMS